LSNSLSFVLAMRRSSFRWVARRFVPRGNPCKQVLLGAVLVLAGCGGGGKSEAPPQVVRGTGYAFEAPAGWTIVRSGRKVDVSEGRKSLALVSVSRFPLLHKAGETLSSEVVKEVDRLVTGLAAQQHGSIVSSEDTEIAGREARRYEFEYEVRGKPLVERVAFVFRGKTEYFLLCRFAQRGDTAPCDQLLASFRLT
jgi:hypothetical protein